MPLYWDHEPAHTAEDQDWLWTSEEVSLQSLGSDEKDGANVA